MNRNLISNNKGMVLVLVVMIMAVLMLLGTALMAVGISESKMSSLEENHLKAHYIAQSGVDIAAKYIMDNPQQAVTLFLNKSTAITGNLGAGTFSAALSGDTTKMKITSVGVLSSENARETVYLELASIANSNMLFENLVYTGSALDLDKVNCTGPLQSAGTITYPTKDINGNLYTSAWPVKPYQAMNMAPFIIPVYDNKDSLLLPNNGTATINSPAEYTDITVPNGATLTLDASASDGQILEIVVTNLYNKGDIKITGGKVILFVRQTLEIQTSGNLNNFVRDTPPSSPGNLAVFLGDFDRVGNCLHEGSCVIQAGQGIGGFIYGPKAEVYTDSGNVTINGAIICETFTANNNSIVTFYKSNSDFNFSKIIYILKKTLYSNS